MLQPKFLYISVDKHIYSNLKCSFSALLKIVISILYLYVLVLFKLCFIVGIQGIFQRNPNPGLNTAYYSLSLL